MNILFLAVDLSALTFTSSVAPQSGAGYDKLLDYRTDTYFQTRKMNNGTVSATRPAGGTVNAVGIVGQNFDVLGGTASFEASLTEGFDVATSSLFTFSASTDTQVYTFPDTSYRFFRIRFEGMDEGTPRMSQLYIGRAVLFDPYLPPFRVENIDGDTVDGVTLNGSIRTAHRHDPRVKTEVRFEFITEASRSAFVDVVETARGRSRPIFFRGHEGVARFVRFGDDFNPVDLRGYNLNSILAVRLKTQETSGLWNLQGPNATSSIDLVELGPIPDWKYITSVS